MACPGGAAPGHNVEPAVTVFEPAGDDVGPTFLVKTAEPAKLFAGQKPFDLLLGQLAHLASPLLVWGCRGHSGLPPGLTVNDTYFQGTTYYTADSGAGSRAVLKK